MQFCLASDDHKRVFSKWNTASRLEERTCRPVLDGKRTAPDSDVVTLAFFQEETENTEPIGRFVYFDINPRNRSAEFGYIVHPSYRGQGIGTKMLSLAIDHLFSTTDLNKLYCQTAAFNTASIRLLEKLNFQKDGILREHHELDGKLWDDIVYSILRREWTGISDKNNSLDFASQHISDEQRYDTIQSAIRRQNCLNRTVMPIARNDEEAGTWKIRPYRPTDEAQWLRCRVLAFLDTAYFDNVYREKEHYPNPSIELVAEVNQQIVGFIDIECEEEPGRVCSPPVSPSVPGKAGMIWNLAVHPNYRRQGIGKALLEAAAILAKQAQLQRFEAWTRDDASILRWYEAQGFQKVDTYLHVYLQNEEVQRGISSSIPGLLPIHVFAQYRGKASHEIRQQFRRVHECNRYDLSLI